MVSDNMTSRETPRYYHEEPPPLSEGTKELFMRYAKIPEGEIVGHLKEVVCHSPYPSLPKTTSLTDTSNSATKPGLCSSIPASAAGVS